MDKIPLDIEGLRKENEGVAHAIENNILSYEILKKEVEWQVDTIDFLLEEIELLREDLKSWNEAFKSPTDE